MSGNSESRSKKRSYRAAFTEPPELFAGRTCEPNFICIESVSQFLGILDERESTVSVLMGSQVAVDACKQMKGIVNSMANKFPDVLFMEVDVDKVEDLRRTQHLETMPSFVIYQHGQAIHRIDGAFPDKLITSLCKATGRNPKELNDRILPSGTEDLIHYINMKKSECLNVSDDTPFEKFVALKGPIVSDCDEELILSYGFNQDIMLRSFKIQAPVKNGPSMLKIFVNQLKSADFDVVKSMIPTQERSLQKEDLNGEVIIELDLKRFKKVSNVCFYIPGNQSGAEVTQLDSLKLFGEPVSKTKGISGRTIKIVTL